MTTTGPGAGRGETRGLGRAGTEGGLSVVVVAYGPPASLAAALGPVGHRYEVVVVDNSSSSSVRQLAAEAGARYVDPGENLGFAAAVNRALRMCAEGNDVLLLNADARITSGVLEALRHRLHARADLAAVAPALRSATSNRPVPGLWPWHTPVGAWAEAVGLARLRLRRLRPESSRYFLGGAVLLLRAGALADVGVLDERFFLYGEDEDWQRRALARGWVVRHCPDVQADHAGGGTEPDPTRLQRRVHAGIERYVRKWYGAGGWTAYRAAVLFGQILRMAAHRGARRAADARLARLYLAGPDRLARRTGAIPAGR
jgi:GT2 family glycosyltransferase